MELYQYTLPSGAPLTGYMREPTVEMPAYNIRPAVLVLPGGGYGFCSPREADPVAMQFLAAGYQTFTLLYSVGEKARDYQPLTDAAGAILHLRQNAARLHLDPDKIIVCGFSAGGHLAASTALLYDVAPLQKALGITGRQACPNAVVLGYPVVSMGECTHKGTRDNVTGNDAAQRNAFSLEKHARPGDPPFFIWHTVDDESVPVQNSLLLAQALQACHTSFEMHLFPTGIHGMSTCTDEVNTPSAHNAHWLPLCIEWLAATLGFHI